ncbi:MAG TPA: hypothetical protein VK570_02215, partial [Rubrivivax sp.]|nr:hypothetical protein [Rubrivivax sp.]
MSALALPALPAATRTTPMLWRCLVLAVLLHVWLLVLLGSAPGGTARQGEGVWGAINVTLRGPPAPGAAAPMPPPALPQSGPPGTAKAPRSGGSVRQTAPEAHAEAGAAQLGQWARQSTPDPAPPLETSVKEPLPGARATVPSPAPTASPQLPLLAAPLPAAPVPPGRVVEERAEPVLVPLAPIPALPEATPSQAALPATPAVAPPSLPGPTPALPPGPAPAERSLDSPLARPSPPPARLT